MACVISLIFWLIMNLIACYHPAVWSRRLFSGKPSTLHDKHTFSPCSFLVALLHHMAYALWKSKQDLKTKKHFFKGMRSAHCDPSPLVPSCPVYLITGCYLHAVSRIIIILLPSWQLKHADLIFAFDTMTN